MLVRELKKCFRLWDKELLTEEKVGGGTTKVKASWVTL